jgi:E3 ubiquitin-protein ligase HECTD1
LDPDPHSSKVLDPDPHSSKMLDPDPHITNADPKHWSPVTYALRPCVCPQVLLRHGANPDLRDEDGKTPLDKARERNDEGHREVAQLLQSPGDWMVSSSSESAAAVAAVRPDAAGGGSEEGAPPPPRGDPEMVARYVSSLLPVFCTTFTATMIPSVKRAALGLVKKLVHYMDGPTLDTVSRAEVAGGGDGNIFVRCRVPDLDWIRIQ